MFLLALYFFGHNDRPEHRKDTPLIRHGYTRIFPALLAALLLPAIVFAQAPTYQCRIAAEYPHDVKTSTQGLFFHNGQLYESSGGFGASFLAMVDLTTGRHIRTQPISGKYFAEGIAPHGNQLYMLTWLSGTGFTHDLETLAPVDSFAYRIENDTTEGWGLASDNTRFILSAGTARLYFHRSEDFARVGSILVRDGATPVRLLNELEYVGGMILANIWKSDTIAVIAPDSGKVIAWLDLAPLRQRLAAQCGVANGIAYDKDTGRLYATGKHWNKLFEIKIDEVLWRQPVVSE